MASVTTGTDNLWDELVLDSGSVSTACPYAWCSDISLNNEDKVHLQDIPQRRIPSHGSRVVPLELWGPEGCVECKVKFDVADVAYPVVSLGKMIESSFTFSFDDYKCHFPPAHHFCCSQCNIVALGRRSPIQPSAVGDGSLMWPRHITGTPGCSTPLCSVPQHCTQGR